ncbi:MAG: DUF4837 family protein [Rikenellaceae bacterium]
MKNILLFFTMLFALIACNSSSADKSAKDSYRPESTGTPYEVFVIATAGEWNGIAGDTLRAVLGQNVEMLNMEEPYFGVKYITKASLNNLIAKHRNLILFNIADSIKTTTITADYDVKSAPQVIVSMTSPSADSLAKYISDNRAQVLEFFDNIEQDRFVARMRKYPAKDLNKLVDSMFNIQISIPTGYLLRNVIGDDFAWISYEMPFASQGIVIYSYPYTEGMVFDSEFMTEKRNQYVSQIPGQLENTFMTTSEYVQPVVEVRTINGTEWIETKGFWDLKNDFMGGPFRSYTTVDKTTNKVITIDTYVFSPKESKGKRNFVKQLEAVVRTIKLK